MKRCWKCKIEQPLENFANNRSKRSGKSAECRACVKIYNKSHVAEKADYYRNYRKAKRLAKLAWYLFLECRTRAKRNGIDFDLEPQDILIPSICPVFKVPFVIGNKAFAASVDRIDSSKGYVRGNVRVISNLANRMKTNATQAQLEQFAQWILENSNGPKRGMDPGKSTAENQNHHASQALGESCTWTRRNDEVASDSSNGVIAQDLARLVFH